MAQIKQTSSAKKGGLFVGKSHAEGGIPAIVTDTGQPIEVEGGEAIINKKATALHWEELSKINQSAGGGVPIPPPDDADKVLEKFEQGGKITVKEKKLVFDKWRKLVNMTYTELSRYYHSKDGQTSGLTESEAKSQGISFGRESAEWILKMKKTNWRKWSDDMWKWANKQISFISRMSGMQGDLTDEKGKKTPKYKALLIWGNDPKKKNAHKFATGGSIQKESCIDFIKNSEAIKNNGYYFEFKNLLLSVGAYDIEVTKINSLVLITYNSGGQENLKAIDTINSTELANNLAKLLEIDIALARIIVYNQTVKSKRFDANLLNSINNKNIVIVDRDTIVCTNIDSDISFKTGGQLLKRKDGSHSQRGLWDNIRANAGSGKEPTKEMLEQEAKIKQKFHLGGDMSKHLAPNGQPSKLTHEQWHLVRTPKFKAWFGDWENSPESSSKVVDENGEPLVVWRGESKNFNVFDYKKLGSKLKTAWRNAGFFFAPTKSSAEQYMFFMGSGLLKQFFLNIRNPYTLDSVEFFGTMDWGSLPTQRFKSNKLATDFAKEKIEEIKSENCDGAFVTILKDDNVVEIIAFNPNQIKLADGTNTTFDENNPDIRFKGGGKISDGIEDFSKVKITNDYYPQNIIAYVNPKELLDRHLIDEPDFSIVIKGNQIGNRVETAKKYLEDYLKNPKLIHDRTGERTNYDATFHASVVGIYNGKLSFTDGRHRVLSAYLLGLKFVPISIPKKQVQIFKESFSSFILPDKNEKTSNSRFEKGGLIAPNGQPSGLYFTEIYNLVRTPEFKAWFGDWEEAYKTKDYDAVSKIIDENGEPLICVHNTNNEFYEFDEFQIGSNTDQGYYGKGFYFTPTVGQSNYGQIELNCFLNIKNPYFKQSSHRNYELNSDDLKDKGYDGVVVYPNWIENMSFENGVDKSEEIVTYYPEQIKLGNGTNTTFDKYNPDIRFEDGGAVKSTSPDLYENKLLQIRVIGSENNYYKRVNQEWQFLTPDEIEKLKNGTKHELEHTATIEAIKRRDIPNEIVATFIAYDHINEDPNYYQKLDKAIPEKMARGKVIDIPVVFKQTMGDYKIWIEEVKDQNKQVFYSGEVYLKNMLLKIFPAVNSDIEELKKIMRKYIDQIKISADENTKETIFIDGRAMKVSKEIYNYVLSKSFKNSEKNIDKKESLRYFVENQQSAGMLSSGTDIIKYDDIDVLRSIMLQIIRDEEGVRNEYTIPYSVEELNSVKDQALIEFKKRPATESKTIIESKPELIAETPAEPIIEENKETKMEEKNQEIVGAVSKWNEVPIRWRNVKATRPITFNLNPYDKNLNVIVKNFLGKDNLRPVFSNIYFDKNGLVCTDAHKLLHIHYKHSDFSGNYATPSSLKTYGYNKDVTLEEASKEIKDQKYANWEAVIPKESTFIYQVDTMKLYQYLQVAINYANPVTNQVVFKFDKNKQIGFNGKFMIQCLEAMMKMQNCPKVYLHLTEPSRSMLISYEKSITPTGNTYCLLMPVMLQNSANMQLYGSADIDNNKYLTCYFDFEDSQIHNGDGSIADYQESYGDANAMPLALITMMDRAIKIAKPKLPILENVCVDGNGIRIYNFDSFIEIANDWGLENGLYYVKNNALVKNTFGSVDDYPRLNNRVSTANPKFTMDSDVFKFYLEKASQNAGNDDLRPVMKSIFIQYDRMPSLDIVATDGITLFRGSLTKYASNLPDEKFDFMMGEVKQLMNFVKNIDSKEISISVEDKRYRIDAGRLHFEAKLEDGKYPNWQSVVPNSYNKELIFDIKDLYVCMNNEASKMFAKETQLKADEINIFNQNNKVFISNQPNELKNIKQISTEICDLKIENKTFDESKTFSSSENFILLMPNSSTNGNYFNFKMSALNKVISTIGKEKVIVPYSDLNRAYIFTSDNLNYKTSDVYKPEKVKSTPVAKTPAKSKIIDTVGKIAPKTITVPKKETPKFTPEVLKVIPKHQLSVLRANDFSEMETAINVLNMAVARVPKIYSQSEIKDKVVYLHYFYGNQDWYVLELDKSNGECYGYADLGYGAELGYMSIPEFVNNGKVELDFYFEPKTWSKINKGKDSAFEKQTKAVKTPAKANEKVMGTEYTVGTKAHAKAVAQKKQFDDLQKSESGTNNDTQEIKQAIKGLEAFLKTSNMSSTNKARKEVEQAIKGLKALLK